MRSRASLVFVFLLIASSSRFEAFAQSSEHAFEDRAKAGVIGALIGELAQTLFTALIENIPLSSVPSWPDKVCGRVEVKRGEEYVTSEHVLYRPFLSGGILGAGFGIWLHERSSIDSGNLARVLLGSQLGMGIGMMVACRGVIPMMNELADPTLRALLKNTALFWVPAIAAGAAGAYFYKGVTQKKDLHTARWSISFVPHWGRRHSQECAEPR